MKHVYLSDVHCSSEYVYMSLTLLDMSISLLNMSIWCLSIAPFNMSTRLLLHWIFPYVHWTCSLDVYCSIQYVSTSHTLLNISIRLLHYGICLYVDWKCPLDVYLLLHWICLRVFPSIKHVYTSIFLSNRHTANSNTHPKNHVHTFSNTCHACLKDFLSWMSIAIFCVLLCVHVDG